LTDETESQQQMITDLKKKLSSLEGQEQSKKEDLNEKEDRLL